MSETYACVSADVKLGINIRLGKFINLYGCSVGDDTSLGAFVEIQKKASVGRSCKVSSHTFICEGVEIGDNCFIGHGVMFCNDNYPRAANPDGSPEAEEDWKGRFVVTKVCDNVSIGTGTTILGGVTIGKGALIGAGSVVTKNIPPGEIWAGNPARLKRRVDAKPWT